MPVYLSVGNCHFLTACLFLFNLPSNVGGSDQKRLEHSFVFFQRKVKDISCCWTIVAFVANKQTQSLCFQ
jgi:hypothetical protein